MVLGAGAAYVLFILFAPAALIYRSEFRTGNELVAKAEAFRRQHGRIPAPEEVEISNADSMRFVYIRCSDDRYLVAFGTTLGESLVYTSTTRKWESPGGSCHQ